MKPAHPPDDLLPSADMRPVVLHTKHAELNAILDGTVTPFARPVVLARAGLRPGPAMASRTALRDAAASGTRQHRGLAARGKETFLSWQYNWTADLFARHPDGFLVVWNGIKGHRKLMADAARAHGRPVAFCERAPLPGRVTIDFRGVNFGCSLPRDPAYYAAWAEAWAGDLTAWRKLRTAITPRGRRAAASAEAPPGLRDGPFIFVPLQVPGDSQLTVHGDWIRDMDTMVDVLSDASHALPDGWHVRVKEHPSARQSLAPRIAARTHGKFRADNTTDTIQQVAASAAVLTVNSSVGLEAFFFDRPVLVLGDAFYGFDGLARKIADARRLRDALAVPTSLGFDAGARDRFMSYLDAEYYPRAEDAAAGRYTLLDAVARDKRRIEIEARLR